MTVGQVSESRPSECQAKPRRTH